MFTWLAIPDLNSAKRKIQQQAAIRESRKGVIGD